MDQYEEIRTISRGSFGTAYLCLRKSDLRQVVIKQVPCDEMNPQEQETAANEVHILSLLRHPNVIQYHSSFYAHSAINIVMAYAAGGTLHDRLRREPHTPLAYEDVMGMLGQLVLGLEHVHSLRILHRDLKTTNILLLGDLHNTVQIGDFGISKLLESRSKASTQLGTPSNWSPELCRGEKYNEASDVWALGCVLYEMLTRQKPFHASNLVATALKVLQGDFAPIDPRIYPDPSLPGLLGGLLRTDSAERVTLPQIKSHPALVPHLYRLYVDMGRIQ